MLAKRFQEHQDPEAAAKLVTSHLRLVAKIAMGYRGYGLPTSELISEGNIGLMQGVKKFEPDRGFRLATYAMWWIRASIQEYILRSWSLVKMGTTAAQKKLFFNLRRMKNQIDAFEEGDLKPADVTKIATDLGVTEEEVVSMNRRMAMGGDTSLNAPLRDTDGEGQWQWTNESYPADAVSLRSISSDNFVVVDTTRGKLTEQSVKSPTSDFQAARGHYGIDRKFFLPPLRLTVPEAIVLFLAARLIRRWSDEYDAEVVSAPAAEASVSARDGRSPSTGKHPSADGRRRSCERACVGRRCTGDLRRRHPDARLHLRRRHRPRPDRDRPPREAGGRLQHGERHRATEHHQRIAPAHLLKALLDDEQGMAAGLIEAADGSLRTSSRSARSASSENSSRRLFSAWRIICA